VKHPRFYVAATLLFAAVAAVPLIQWSHAFGQEKDRDTVPAVRWEYNMLRFYTTDAKEIEEKLNKLGKDGWETSTSKEAERRHS